MNRHPSFAHTTFTSIFTVAIFLFTTNVRAETAMLPVQSDTTLSESNPGNNLGGNPQILAGTDGSGRLRRGLLTFDLASTIPAEANIHSATLYLTATSANPAAGDFHLHRMLAEWGEGTGGSSSGAPAILGDATWNSPLHGTSLWAAPGGLAGTDYFATSSSTKNVSTAGEYAFTGLAADLQFMLDNPALNFGWMLISGREGTAQTARQFVASEAGSAAVARLEIEYSMVPEPAGISLAIIGVALACGRWIRHRITAAL
jgi:hypothetical protein